MYLKVSVIVPVYNDDKIYNCIDALKKQTLAKNFYEVIVVENGSFKKYNNITEDNIKYRYSKKQGRSIARNIGLKLAKGKYVFFTDADCVPDNHRLENGLNFLDKNKGYVGFGGTISPYNAQTNIEKYGKNLGRGQKKLQYLSHISPLPYVVFANAGFVKEKIIEIGGFDNIYQSGGDVDICRKLGLSKYNIGICKNAIVNHKNRTNIYSYSKTYIRYSTYQVLLAKRYNKKLFIFNPYPWALYSCAIKSLLNGEIKKFRWWYDIVEATSVLFGGIKGAILFKKFYL